MEKNIKKYQQIEKEMDQMVEEVRTKYFWVPELMEKCAVWDIVSKKTIPQPTPTETNVNNEGQHDDEQRDEDDHCGNNDGDQNIVSEIPGRNEDETVHVADDEVTTQKIDEISDTAICNIQTMEPGVYGMVNPSIVDERVVDDHDDDGNDDNDGDQHDDDGQGAKGDDATTNDGDDGGKNDGDDRCDEGNNEEQIIDEEMNVDSVINNVISSLTAAEIEKDKDVDTPKDKGKAAAIQEIGRPNRAKNLSKALKSPYVDREVGIGDKLTMDELKIYEYIMSPTLDKL